MTITEYLRGNAHKYTNKEDLIADCIKELGVEKRRVQKVFSEIKCGKNPLVFTTITSESEVAQFHSQKIIGLSESDLRKKHDVHYIATNAAKALQPGIYLIDADFIKSTNLRSQSGYRQVLDASEFDIYRGKASGTVYWSHPDSIRKMKIEGILN
jgi:hypothetical protein